jgi:hypothetical protein
MTENARASGQQFGRMVVQTESGEVFSLDLFETPDLVCRGFYFPPAETLRQRRTEYTNATSLPMSEVELRASQEAIAELQRTSDIRTHRQQDSLFFEVYGDRFEMFGAVDRVRQRSEAGLEVWTGGVYEPQQVSFVLERYGTPELVVMITFIYLSVFVMMDFRANALDEVCWRRAVEMCGEHGIKSCKFRRTLGEISASLDENLDLTGISAKLGFSHDCEIECK